MKEHYPLRGNVTTILSPFKEGTKEYDFANMDAQGVDLKTTWIPFGWSTHSHSGGL